LVKKRGAKGIHFKTLLHSSNSTLNFYVHEDNFGSSTKKEFESKKNLNFIRMNCESLDNLMKRSPFEGPYFIKIDTQGSELEILQGSLRTLSNTDALLVEVSVQDFFIESHTLLDLSNFLCDNGFRIFDVADLTYRPSDGFLAQFDVLFVRKNSKLFDVKNYI
jgi:hypothetical protein